MMIEIIGFSAGILIALSILPQIIKSLKTKKVDDISFWMLIIILAGEILWIIYGVMLLSYPIIAMDGFAFAATVIMLYMKLKYQKK